MRATGGCCPCRFDPLWNSLVIGGMKHDGTPFLGTVGMIGTAYTDVHVATGEQTLLRLPLHWGAAFHRTVRQHWRLHALPCCCTLRVLVNRADANQQVWR
jgi:hypothetical protein